MNEIKYNIEYNYEDEYLIINIKQVKDKIKYRIWSGKGEDGDEEPRLLITGKVGTVEEAKEEIKDFCSGYYRNHNIK